MSVSGWIAVDGPGNEATSRARVSIPELGIAETVEVDAAGRGAFSFRPSGMELWTPESPRLYRVVIETEHERVEDRVGFRPIEVRGGDIVLNGEPVYLRGINAHEESPLRPGRAHTEEDAARFLDWVGELNGNFLRLAHYPHNERIVRLADERGILLSCEIPICWSIRFDNPRTLSLAKQMLGEMIDRDKNRAAVILWSVANETPRTETRRIFLEELIEHIRRLDSTRLVTAALLPTTNRASLAREIESRARGAGSNEEPIEITLDDPIGDSLDVVGHNAYCGWYYSSRIARAIDLPVNEIRDAMLEAMPSFRWSMPFDKPMIFSEFGGGAKRGLRGDDGEVWTEDYQARLHRAQLAMIDNIPFVRGTAPWILRDFCSPMRQLGGIQDDWNQKGFISSEEHTKLAFDVLKEHYARKKEVWSRVP